MGVQTLHYLAPVSIGTTNLGGITATDNGVDNEIRDEPSSGELTARIQALVRQGFQPTFSTQDIATALAACGSLGCSLATKALKTFAQAGSDDGRRAASGHIMFTYQHGLLLPQSLDCNHQGDCSLTYQAIVTWDGTHDPLVPTSGASLPAITGTSLWTLKSATLAGVPITAAGWTKAADTGQINWTTVTAPATTNTAAGFEIWQTEDVDTTWYLKIEYGSGSTATYPAIWVTLGSGTNGTGTLTGQVSSRLAIASGATDAANTSSCAFAGGTAWFATAMFYDKSAAQTFGFMVERLKNADGSEADTGMVLHGWCTGHRYHQLVPKTGTVWAVNDSTTNSPSFPMMTPPYGLTTAVAGVKVGINTLHPWSQIHWPAILGGVVYFTSVPDVSNYATFAVTRYGNSHTYLSLGSYSSSGTNMALAIRYE